MRRLVIGLASMLIFGPTGARAESPMFVDSLVPQVFHLTQGGHESVRRRVLGSTGLDSLTDDQRMVVMATLDRLESACRSNLLPKAQEPGSPWLTWRPYRRVDVDDTAWYVSALSCVDALCGANTDAYDSETPLVVHDRLALVGVGPVRSRVLLLPPEASTIGDEGSAIIDSVASVRGDDCTIVQVRRRLQSDHPCYDGGDVVATDEHYFLVLRGDSLAQAFMMVPREEWDSHDDVDGDLETDRTASVSVSPTSILMSYQVEERWHSPDGDESKTRTKITKRGVVRLAYDKRSGRFRRLE